MILVIVGMHYQGFDRLVKKMDQIASKINEKVIIQAGGSTYIPKCAESLTFVPYDDILDLINEARLVICHDGAGTILDILNSGKFPIIVPRLKKFGEVAYDNQAELALCLENKGMGRVVFDVEDLEDIVRVQVGRRNMSPGRSRLIGVIAELLKSIEDEKDSRGD